MPSEELPAVVWVPLVIVSLAALVYIHRHTLAVLLGLKEEQMKKKIVIAAAVVMAAGVAVAGCSSDARKASTNLSTAADNFEVQRMIVGINGITDEVLFSVEGRCSIERDGDLVVTCKHGENDYRKHYLGLSDNVTYVSTQLEGVDVSVYHTRIILKPQNILPDFDLSVGRK